MPRTVPCIHWSQASRWARGIQLTPFRCRGRAWVCASDSEQLQRHSYHRGTVLQARPARGVTAHFLRFLQSTSVPSCSSLIVVSRTGKVLLQKLQLLMVCVIHLLIIYENIITEQLSKQSPPSSTLLLQTNQCKQADCAYERKLAFTNMQPLPKNLGTNHPFSD